MPSIHPTALVSPEAILADDVSVGPFTMIDGPVKLAAGVKVDGHVRLTGDVEIGESSTIGWGSVVGADPQDFSFDPTTPSGVRIGANNTLREYVTIHRGSKAGAFTTLGEGNFLMTGVHLAHDVILGERNVLANNVLLAGHIQVGDRVFLGGGSAFHQFIRIGDYAMVRGLGAISMDVPPYCVAHGENQLAGLNVVGLRRAGFDPAARAEIKSAFKLLFASGHPLRLALAHAGERTWSAAAQVLVDAVANPSKKSVLTR